MKIILATVLLPLATAHLCLLSPQQRGSMMNINTPGTDDCKLLTGPCGARNAEHPRVILRAGMKERIVFQKNLDHYNMDKPGSFMVNIADVNDMKQMMNIDYVSDSNTTDLYLYNLMVDVPKMEIKHAVLQVIYTTMNPTAPSYFYQCADVTVSMKI